MKSSYWMTRFSSVSNGSPSCNFHECTLGWKGSRAAVRFSKMSIIVHCHFEKGSQNQHF